MMRLLWIAGSACLFAAAVLAACSSDNAVVPVVQQIDDAGGNQEEDAEPVEQAATTFPCGAGNTCNVGQHACCQVGGAFACFPIASGCPAVQDAGADADGGPPGPALLCITYNNCPPGRDCCYRPDVGSMCMESCPSNYENLCRLGMDNCGRDEDCEPMDDPPMPNIGRCDD